MIGFGLGIATENAAGKIIEAYFPRPGAIPSAIANGEAARELARFCGTEPGAGGFRVLAASEIEDCRALIGQATGSGLEETAPQAAHGDKPALLCLAPFAAKPASIPEAFLKLHLLSHRIARPHEQNIEGIFAVLENLAWTDRGPVSLDELPEKQLAARARGEWLGVHAVDKFPRMADYVVPAGVRIADSARVRLGAYIGEGTTVMHEGFINFNAGAAGQAMIEGRISAGVVVGEGSDLGGSSSTMGTLSGGGAEIVSVGRGCLIGANAGIGMPLADGCIVEAGLYLTAGAVVRQLDAAGETIRTCKAKELAGLKNQLFRRNSLSGAIECLPRKGRVELNEDLHAHN
ncbi:MAG: DapH/DapD/GlmU-related protein [Gammaproteobacteria bacterium]|nr:DapH/DapD/GlmU-related protein [Gammaproteobacteria bacterium]